MNRKRLALVPALTAGIIACTAAAAQASTIVVYEGSHFSGESMTIDACGPSDIPERFHGSYKWYATGQSASMYNLPGGKGRVHHRLSAHWDNEQKTPFGWKSMIIHC
ncbi:MiAMP1 family antimicrobial peptide [Actinomadura livida]|uniref:Uncharacterized protein n=1 Tax=Actinomadura livida TaxID=79909 RepID=A0A7W7N1M3_9ACTN|nr:MULTISPECIES: MiAMP1 family antimicrobial peptide [Actinomadura]MBB4778100.1 hypothetical protein [Actinomadura catellatispora]GGU28792.1 hypothetical protein GCM10010208_61890 [Actinomadura livida]